MPPLPGPKSREATQRDGSSQHFQLLPASVRDSASKWWLRAAAVRFRWLSVWQLVNWRTWDTSSQFRAEGHILIANPPQSIPCLDDR